MANRQVETEFEKRRGVNKVEMRGNFAQINVYGLTPPVSRSRLSVLDRVAACGVSIDFLKLTSDGLGFCVDQKQVEVLRPALQDFGANVTYLEDRSVVLVHAVNMRDEEGLIARIVSSVLTTGATIDHMGDMHDRLLIVLESKSAENVARVLKATLVGSPI